ncbi:hypothetical protein BC351_03470 [Paenibacillus ferrarius]|uniref:Helicase XPB/Ssl2 N-terminal domain-containing protein n=1 Tax=Paenibacillus ferrarius TaxID=1469647 RepID=A0A1V4HJX0_9BACL|nr:helicase-associated domain-containing protein [Paenibacillus ferrarius]OPH57595.1 hypothetical protein BC351_03470 [Paenibacillus ferrarius]
MTVLAETHYPDFEAVRGELSRFVDIVKSPEHLHTYRISPLSLWNAAAAGLPKEENAAENPANTFSLYDKDEPLILLNELGSPNPEKAS